jgi:hypothetical protein
MQNFDDYFINMPGRVVEFFPDTQTATIRICAERIYSSSTEIESSITRGLLEGVPVHVLSGGGWSVTMPITVGDSCVLFFSQVGYDHWLYEDKDVAGTQGGQPMYWLNRKFDIQDGYALVGLNTIPRAIQGYSATASQWRNVDSTQMISLNSDGTIDVISDSLVKVTSPTVEVISTTEVLITTPKATFSGEVIVAGNITCAADIVATGEVTGKGVELSTHTHPITTGSSAGNTGAPS